MCEFCTAAQTRLTRADQRGAAFAATWRESFYALHVHTTASSTRIVGHSTTRTNGAFCLGNVKFASTRRVPVRAAVAAACTFVNGRPLVTDVRLPTADVTRVYASCV